MMEDCYLLRLQRGFPCFFSRRSASNCGVVLAVEKGSGRPRVGIRNGSTLSNASTAACLEMQTLYRLHPREYCEPSYR
jgi:hypothetical protein